MAKEIDQAEFRFFLTGGVSLGEALPDCPASWVAPKLWGEMNRLDKIGAFKGWIDHFNEHHEYYRGMYEHSTPQDFPLHERFKHLDKFQFMCI